MSLPSTPSEPATAALAAVCEPTSTDWDHAWCVLEPSFSDKKLLKLWARSPTPERTGNRFFTHRYPIGLCKLVAKDLVRKYRKAQRRGEAWCLFDEVERERDDDAWGVPRQCLIFSCSGVQKTLKMRLGIEAETVAFSIGPVPVVWLHDPRFVQFLQELIWDVPQQHGLGTSLAHAGGRFALSAKTFLVGSLLCDDIADKLNHPELACFSLGHPSRNGRSFRATRSRRAAFQRLIEQYWAGAFHPRAIGTPRVENAYFDRGFLPSIEPPEDLMSREHNSPGPVGTLQEAFQNNFAFGRGVRTLAQSVHPGHWQEAHPDSTGCRLDQVMRYSEANLNRLRIVGEVHVQADHALDPGRVCELEAPLDPHMLHDEASWKYRAQSGRTSARDYVEALLLEVHRAQYLQRHPFVQPRPSLLQDQLLADAEETLARHGAEARLAALRNEARRLNLGASHGRIKSDFIEPETLLWESWQVLPTGERAAIAREAIRGFTARVIEAASCDPRPDKPADPMHWHRHRIHPILWHALLAEGASGSPDRDTALRELRLFKQAEAMYCSRRPPWSITEESPPWSGLAHEAPFAAASPVPGGGTNSGGP